MPGIGGGNEMGVGSAASGIGQGAVPGQGANPMPGWLAQNRSNAPAGPAPTPDPVTGPTGFQLAKPQDLMAGGSQDTLQNALGMKSSTGWGTRSAPGGPWQGGPWQQGGGGPGGGILQRLFGGVGGGGWSGGWQGGYTGGGGGGAGGPAAGAGGGYQAPKSDYTQAGVVPVTPTYRPPPPPPPAAAAGAGGAAAGDEYWKPRHGKEPVITAQQKLMIEGGMAANNPDPAMQNWIRWNLGEQGYRDWQAQTARQNASNYANASGAYNREGYQDPNQTYQGINYGYISPWSPP